MSRRWFGVKSFIGRSRWKVRKRIGHDWSSKGMQLKGGTGVFSPGRCVSIDLPTAFNHIINRFGIAAGAHWVAPVQEQEIKRR